MAEKSLFLSGDTALRGRRRAVVKKQTLPAETTKDAVSKAITPGGPERRRMNALSDGAMTRTPLSLTIYNALLAKSEDGSISCGSNALRAGQKKVARADWANPTT